MSNYLIDYTNLTIHNADSNGVKAIHDISGLWANVPHIVYINDDGRKWYQPITGLELVEYYRALNAQDEPFTANDYSMGVAI